MPLPHEKRRSPYPYPMLFERFTYGSPSNPMGSPYPFKSPIRYVKLLTLCRNVFSHGVIWGTRGGSAGFAWGNPWGKHGVTHGVTLQIPRDAARQVRVRKPRDDACIGSAVDPATWRER